MPDPEPTRPVLDYQNPAAPPPSVLDYQRPDLPPPPTPPRPISGGVLQLVGLVNTALTLYLHSFTALSHDALRIVAWISILLGGAAIAIGITTRFRVIHPAGAVFFALWMFALAVISAYVAIGPHI